MGWVWRDEPADVGDSLAGDVLDRSSGDRCSIRKILRSQCKTEEVEPGRFIRKCNKTEEILRNCIGKPVEVLHSNREYTVEDVTDQVVKGPFALGRSEDRTFDVPGLRSDIEAIEGHFSDGLRNFFDAAEEMMNGLYGIFGDLRSGEPLYTPSKRREIPIEGHSEVKSSIEPNEPGSDRVDFSSLAKDI